MNETPEIVPQAEPEPRHLRPHTLHNVVLALWIAVGVFTGAGIAATIGAVELGRHQHLSVSENIAFIGGNAGPLYAAAVVALGAIAVVEAVLITLGHVQVHRPE